MSSALTSFIAKVAEVDVAGLEGQHVTEAIPRDHLREVLVVIKIAAVGAVAAVACPQVQTGVVADLIGERARRAYQGNDRNSHGENS